jgi:hypothetical protein
MSETSKARSETGHRNGGLSQAEGYQQCVCCLGIVKNIDGPTTVYRCSLTNPRIFHARQCHWKMDKASRAPDPVRTVTEMSYLAGAIFEQVSPLTISADTLSGLLRFGLTYSITQEFGGWSR